MLLIHPNLPTTSNTSAACSQIIESRDSAEASISGKHELPTASNSALYICKYEGKRSMPGNEQIAAAMRRFISNPEDRDVQKQRLVESFVNDINEVLPSEISK